MKNYLLTLILLSLLSPVINAQETNTLYLSGTGLGDTMTWEFLCSGGRKSGRWSKIEVPSQWELQGFGEYTYGRWYKQKGVRNPSMEQGIYRRSFRVPENWKERNVRLWFDGVMTDTEVSVNGQAAGKIHRGGFYRFSYDVTPLLKYGKTNQIEVRVKKHSDNKSVNAAERRADWWLFGGIYRPVWLEAKPEVHIERIAVKTSEAGDFHTTVFLKGNCEGYKLVATINSLDGKYEKSSDFMLTDTLTTQHIATRWENIQSWTPETPHLYQLTLELVNKENKTVHRHHERIGFRTVEFRPQDGIYVNGTKIVMKGINRHSFHPDGGRTTNREISIQDVQLMKEMNMNAVRFHYPPDKHFLDACDSLGLFVINELAGWQNSYDTETGKQLVKEMVTRDVNHPSIILWSNGNEGGWNKNMDPLFHKYDPQKRHVIHPWADFDGLDTHHYPAFLTGVARFTNGYKVFMPTEFMHGQYDQGHGAGLEDFWNNYTEHPLFAGGFMWDFSDNAVRRSDRNNRLDSENYNAADGILGPYREKEASYYTVREIWSPIRFGKQYITTSFDGRFLVTNNYLYTNLDQCRMRYNIYSNPSPITSGEQKLIASGSVKLPALEPRESGYARMEIPANFYEGDVLEIIATAPDGKTICNWTWPIHYAADYLSRQLNNVSTIGNTSVKESDSLVILTNGNATIQFNKSDATIHKVVAENKEIPFSNGPVAVGMKMKLTGYTVRQEKDMSVFTARYIGGVDSIVWRLHGNGLVEMDALILNRASGGGGFDDAFMDEEVYNLGFSFSYPESVCTGMKWFGRGPYRVWKNRIPGTNYGTWQKAYNNTITGESFEKLIYPEFKGYHANLYWATIESETSPFTVYSGTDGLFFRVFTPEEPEGRQDGINTMPDFPAGDLSFLLDIPAIRSFKPISQHGPKSQPGNIRIKKGDEGLRIHIVFDFR